MTGMRTNLKRLLAGGAILGAIAALPLAGASTAHAADGGPTPKNALACTTRAEGRDAFVDCTNPTNVTIAFRAVVVCGTGLDGKSDWITVNPGEKGWVQYRCGESSTGVGSINWEEG
ncbi:hypothetical protein K378_02844 [Streptomyces sp. Amel2xB2]|uniref:hypothetical protein n=1 Tax=Streptomyces sp. Amel2xB2 TaxID=1305829 RepID=UPI000DBF73D0|nr:hypothetical protein [Streptomyces sp. Amel2xB2]RAJ66672.1 hypothetical protein K378_02844 [Streptomyces sp. Amel2xB2]